MFSGKLSNSKPESVVVFIGNPPTPQSAPSPPHNLLELRGRRKCNIAAAMDLPTLTKGQSSWIITTLMIKLGEYP